jgi:hypothetical protein
MPCGEEIEVVLTKGLHSASVGKEQRKC